jgi:hypothetical protein
LIFLFTNFSYADEKEKKFLELITKDIQDHNYVCKRAEKQSFVGETERGGIFHIYCDSYKFAYKVIVTPKGSVYVTPLRK